jgi:hypothetical protein
MKESSKKREGMSNHSNLTVHRYTKKDEDILNI